MLRLIIELRAIPYKTTISKMFHNISYATIVCTVYGHLAAADELDRSNKDVSITYFFWLLALVAVVKSAHRYINLMVSQFYHPMAAHGDFLFPLKMFAVSIPIIILIVMCLLWLWRRPLPLRLYQVGLGIIILATCIPHLPRVESDYRQVYWLNNEMYKIPWQYGPRNGSPNPGGKYFVIEVSPKDMKPGYKTKDRTITLSKAIAYNSGKGGPAPKKRCETKFHQVNCQWTRNGSFYSASGREKGIPADIDGLIADAEALLDSFKQSDGE